jgi:hypothetical protein
MPYDTRMVADGSQALTASVRDAASNTGTRSVSVTVKNGTTPPPPPPPPPPALSASFTSPAAGATVSGTTTVAMSAAGGTAPYTYTLRIDGTQVASGASATYGWNTAGVANGSHTLGLTVRDAAGATATATRTVSVSNVTPPPPPPPTGTLKVYITGIASNATVRGTVWPVLWIEGQSGSSNTYTLSANGRVVATQVTPSRGPVALPWATTSTANGTATLSATVRDATGKTGTASISVRVAN